MPVLERRASTAAGKGGAVAAAHPAAVEAGLHILRSGGTAADAVIAAQAMIGVVAPQSGGLGGDCLALVHPAPGHAARRSGTGPGHDAVVAVNGAGASARNATDRTVTGGGSVTVPGAVGGWDDLHRLAGRLPLAELLAPAIDAAVTGIDLDPILGRTVQDQRSRIAAGGGAGWSLLDTAVGRRWRQPELADCLSTIAARGAAAFYRGPIAAAVTAAVRDAGGALDEDDLAVHAGTVAAPIRVPWGGLTLWVQPPMSQGVLLAVAASWLERHLSPDRAESGDDWFATSADLMTVDRTGAGPVERGGLPEQLDHVLVEVTEAAFAMRADCARGADLVDVPLTVDPQRASRRGGPRPYLHTAGAAAVDAEGQVVSSLISVFDDFGSGVFVPEYGFVLNNRAAGFTDGANAFGPGRRPVHTLAPALLTSPRGTALALATPGADGQIQTLLQVLHRLRAGDALDVAVGAPRWRTESARLLVESDHPNAGALAARGHEVSSVEPGADVFGSVVAAGWLPESERTVAVGDWRRTTAAGAISDPPAADPLPAVDPSPVADPPPAADPEPAPDRGTRGATEEASS